MIKDKKYQKLSLLIILFGAIALISLNAFALQLGVSESEKAIFAFHKLTNQTPDYQRLVENMNDYKNETEKSAKQRVFEQQFTRLKLEYPNFSPSKNYLRINTDIFLQMRMKDGKPALFFKFLNSGDQEVPYFPYPFAEDWIAVIAKGLNRFASIGLSEEQYARAQVLFEFDKTYKGKLNLELRPISAEKEDPVFADGANQWLMLADIARLEFMHRNPNTGKNESVLGEYKAKWYR